MTAYRRAYVPGGSYFFTVVTERRQPVLTHADVRVALRDAISIVQEILPFRIDGWVLLPDHLHAIWTLPEGDADFSTRWRLIKRHVTRTCAADYARPEYLTERRAAKQCGTFWQHRFWEHLLRDERDLRQHLDYLHGNPPEAWPRRAGGRLAMVFISSMGQAWPVSGRLGRHGCR